MKIGSAPSPQVTQPTASVQGSSKLQGAQQFQGLEQYQGAVEDLAQHLAADTSLNPGQMREQAEGALRGLTGLDGGALQKLIQQTMDRVNDIRLSSGDRWLSSPTSGGPGDIFTLGTGRPGGGSGGGPFLV